MSDPTTVNFLIEFHTPEEIRDFWKQVGAALFAKVAVNIQINSHSANGTSHNGISLSTQEEQRSFMAACEEALRIKENKPVDPARLGTIVNFSHRAVSV